MQYPLYDQRKIVIGYIFLMNQYFDFNLDLFGACGVICVRKYLCNRYLQKGCVVVVGVNRRVTTVNLIVREIELNQIFIYFWLSYEASVL